MPLIVVYTQSCVGVFSLGGRHILDGRGCDFTLCNCFLGVFLLNPTRKLLKQLCRLSFSKSRTYSLSLRCSMRPQLVCTEGICVCVCVCVCTASLLAESYFVSVEKVWDGMSGLCLTEHVCACVGGECV